MTICFRRSFAIVVVVFCGIAAAAARDGLATWPLVAPVTFSATLML